MGGLSVFIKKYYSMFPLTEQEINALIPFIKIRNLNLAIEVNRLVLKQERKYRRAYVNRKFSHDKARHY